MKKILVFLTALFLFSFAQAQQEGHTISNVQFYFADLLEQEKWDFEKQYRWSFYICADDTLKLNAAKKELAASGFTNFELMPNSMGQGTSGNFKLSMLVFDKTAVYIPKTLLQDIDLLYSLEKKLHLSSFDELGNYEMMEEVPFSESTANGKTFIF